MVTKEHVLKNNGTILISMGVGFLVDGTHFTMGLIYVSLGLVLIAAEIVIDKYYPHE